MKVLVLSSLYPNTIQPSHGIFIEHRIRRLRSASGADVRVVAPVPWFPFEHERFGMYAAYARTPRADTRDGIPVLYPRYPALPKVGMNIAPALLAAALLQPLRRLLADGFEFDVIDAYYLYPDGVAATLLGRYFGKPVVATALGSDVNIIARYRWPRMTIRWTGTHAACITTVSQALKTRLVELGVADEKVIPILHGVDHALFAPPSDRASLRARLGLTCRSLLSVGALIDLKGHHIVIAALRDLPDTALLIAGHGARERVFRSLAARLGVADRVRFLGLLDQAELSAWYGAADAVVLASSDEGIPNVLLEAMACGTPVIATRVGGIPEIVTGPQAGVLMTERTPAALVHAVRCLFAAYPERSETKKHAERYSWDSTSEQHLHVLEHVLRRAKAAGAR